MATITLQQLRDQVLVNVGALAAGESSDPDDATTVENAIIAEFDELRTEGLAPFELTAIPEWAQTSLRDIVSFNIAMQYVSDPQRRAEIGQRWQLARRRIYRQTAAPMSNRSVKARYF